jgi:large subunit ribosomal protein L21
VGKYKKRKGYYKKNGHRQSFTRLRVDSILAGGMEKAASAVASEESVEEETQ